MTVQKTPIFSYAKEGQVSIPLQAVVGSTLTVSIPVTAICPNCAPLLEAAETFIAYMERPYGDGNAALDDVSKEEEDTIVTSLRAAIADARRRVGN